LHNSFFFSSSLMTKKIHSLKWISEKFKIQTSSSAWFLSIEFCIIYLSIQMKIALLWVSVLNKWIIWLYWPKSDETMLTMKDKQNFTRFNYIGYFFSLAESFCGTKRVTMITIVNFCIWFNFFFTKLHFKVFYKLYR
jgi:hypothetical protein